MAPSREKPLRQKACPIANCRQSEAVPTSTQSLSTQGPLIGSHRRAVAGGLQARPAQRPGESAPSRRSSAGVEWANRRRQGSAPSDQAPTGRCVRRRAAGCPADRTRARPGRGGHDQPDRTSPAATQAWTRESRPPLRWPGEDSGSRTSQASGARHPALAAPDRALRATATAPDHRRPSAGSRTASLVIRAPSPRQGAAQFAADQIHRLPLSAPRGGAEAERQRVSNRSPSCTSTPSQP